MTPADPHDRHSLPADGIDLDATLTIAWCVDPRGHAHPWLLDHAHHGRPGCACRRCAPHERPGHPIPAHMQQRLDALTSRRRCGRPTRTGRPCRQPVHPDATGCHHHQRQDQP